MSEPQRTPQPPQAALRRSPTSRSSASRSTSSSRPRRRCSAAASCRFGEPPNTHTCPVCLGLPGSLPVANARAVHFGLMIGLALGSELAPRSIFHRKNYFYPDLPKGYQISQYDEPLCRGGELGEVRIHRVHLEEDAAKLIHVGASGRIHGSDASIVDFNRGGTPLAEIVTEPDLRSRRAGRRVAEAAARDAAPARRQRREHGGGLAALRRQHLAAPGRQRRARRQDRAEEHELLPLHRTRHPRRDRAPGRRSSQAAGTVEQETLHFDPASGAITSLRSKEEAHDYRYFPEPDLLPVAIDEEMLDAARAEMTELPADRAERFERELGAERRERPAARLPRRARRLLRGGARRRRRRRRPRRSPTGSPASWPRGSDDGRPARAAASRPRALAALVGRWSPPSRSASAPAARCSTGWSPTAATRARSSRPRGSRRSAAATSSPAIVAAALAANADAAAARARRQRQGDRPDRRLRHARDQGPRRRRRGRAARARAARAV